MQVKSGDIIQVVAISWDEPEWEYDYPTVIVEPIIRYSEEGLHPEQMIEDLAIDLCIGDVESEDGEAYEWRGYKISTLKKVIKNRTDGGTMWKTKLRAIVKQKIEFYTDKEGELNSKVIESISI